MPRIPIEIIYMQTAYQFAKLSYAQRRKVGCVIVKNKQIISFGYNGMPYGFENDCEIKQDVALCGTSGNLCGTSGNPTDIANSCQGDCQCDYTCMSTRREVLHAESNAIMKVAKSTMSCEGAELYTTTCPCFDCAKLIIQAGITKVYYSEDYRDMSGVELLKRAGIKVEQVICWNDL